MLFKRRLFVEAGSSFIMRIIRSLFSNKILIYVFSRYGTYILQFVVSMVIAANLGPYYLGIYGFINLILNYFSQINLGIPHSLNVLLVHQKDDKIKCDNYIINSFGIYGFISIGIFLFILWAKLFNIEFHTQYPVERYIVYIGLIAILTYFNLLMITILRVKNKVNQLSVVQSVAVVLYLIAAILYRGEKLIYALLFCQLLSCIITFFVSLCSRVVPYFKMKCLSIGTDKEILKKGFYLFLYNSCFYFILISIRSIVSNNYVVEEFGAFTFSFTIANAVMLLLDALMTIIFPKIIDLLSSDDSDKIAMTIENLRIAYISTSHLLIYIAMLLFPLIVLLLPKYSNSLTSMNLIALAVLMNANSCGYSSLLIAKNNEKSSAYISGSALIINIVIALVLVKVVHVGFSYVVIATLITYLYFSMMVVWKGKKFISKNRNTGLIRAFFPVSFLIPYLSALLISLFRMEFLIWIPCFLFFILNWGDLITLKSMALKLIKNPNIADL